MKLLSVNVGLPREVEWNGRTIRTSIFKSPVPGRVPVRKLNLDGDQQSDLTVHGGVDKAVYVYPMEHYAFWREEIPDLDIGAWGAFGENLTMDGLLEDAVHIGDQLSIGTAAFTVTQPRLPCYKLQARFQRSDIVKRFMRSGRTGFYLRVDEEGDVGAGDAVTITARHDAKVSITDVW